MGIEFFAVLNSPLPPDPIAESLPDLWQCIGRNRGDAESLNKLGMVYARRGEPLRSYLCHRAAAACQSQDADALYRAGSAALALGQTAEASAFLDESLALNPRCAGAWQKRGDLYLDCLQAPDEALRSYLRAIAVAPEEPRNYQSAARCVSNSGARLRDALPPNADPLYATRGVAMSLVETGNYEDAVPLFHEVLQERPRDQLSMRILAEMADALRDPHAAQSWYERAMAAGDDLMVTTGFIMHWSKRGDYDRARQIYRAKLWDSRHWQGQPIPGKTLRLKVSDTYFGDALHFVRFARVAKQAGARVIVQCPVRLRSLLRTVEGVDATVAPHDPVPPLDFDVNAFWMTYALQVPMNELMGNAPYLRAPHELTAAWAKRIVPSPGINAGLVWRGSPFRIRDRYGSRSMRLEDLRPLAKIPNLTLYSLQCGRGRGELLNATPAFPAIDLAPDFPNTAAAIEALDLVVTIDTSVAHLAGAMGKRTFLMLPYDAFFTWTADSNTTPWYPSIRLFRQKVPGDWSDPVNAVTRTLESRP